MILRWKGMNSKERVLRALNHLEPDRVPRDLGGPHATFSPGVYEKLLMHFEMEEELEVFDERTRNIRVSEHILKKFKIDTRWVYLPPSGGQRSAEGDEVHITDEWGLEYAIKPSLARPEYKKFPLSNVTTLDEIRSYHWPSPPGRREIEAIKEQILAFQEEGYAVGISFGGAWERSWYMRGFDRIFIDFAENRELARALLDKISEIQFEKYKSALEQIGSLLDILILSCDLGTQTSLMISPRHWREYVKPTVEAQIKLFQKMTRAKIGLHSCGAVRPLIPEFIEMGVEILNPVQTTAKGMDPTELKKEYGKDLCFWGGIDTQDILPFGNLEDIRTEVFEKLAVFGKGGGYLFATCQNIQDEVPIENVIALYKAVESWEERFGTS